INGAMHDLARLISRDTLLRVSGPTETSEDQGRGAPHSYPGWQEALLRRVLNANFHFGTMESAKALAAFAARSDAAENMRAEALEELADWPHPSGRDRVVGLWRPVAAVRPAEMAVHALQPLLASILKTAPAAVRVAALHAAENLVIPESGALLSDLIA